MIERLPPQDLESEQGVIDAVFYDAHSGSKPCREVQAALSMLGAEDFYATKNQAIWTAVLAVHKRGERPDPTSVRAELGAAADQHMSGFATVVRNPDRAEQHARIVLGLSKRRRLIGAGHALVQAAYEGDDNGAIAMRGALDHNDQCGEEVSGALPDLLERALAEIRQPVDLKQGSNGCLPWRIRELDTNGSYIRPGDFPIIAARPGLGKSTWALSWALQTAKATGKPVLYASLEMTPIQLAVKALCSEAGVSDPGHMAPTKTEDAKLQDAADFIRQNQVNLFMPERMPRKIADWCTWARAAIHKLDPAALVVDYLGCLRGAGNSQYEKISDVSTSLRALALDTNIPLLALHQMNRAIEGESRLPSAHDLRDSGQLEQDATHIGFLHRARGSHPELTQIEITKGDLLLVWRKSRFGKGHAVIPLVAEYSKSRIVPREHWTGRAKSMHR